MKRAVIAFFMALVAGSVQAGPREVIIQVPVNPRIDIQKYDSLLVMNFASTTTASARFDLNEETVKFLRNELKGRTPAKVLDPSETPSIEGVEDTIFTDASYWQKVGALFPETLIITGRVELNSEHRTGFDTEEVVSPTGVPMRVQRFKEGKFFLLTLNLYFIESATGNVVYSEEFREELTYENEDHPALYGYYELIDRILPRFLGIVIPQKYQETRYLLE